MLSKDGLFSLWSVVVCLSAASQSVIRKGDELISIYLVFFCLFMFEFVFIKFRSYRKNRDKPGLFFALILFVYLSLFAFITTLGIIIYERLTVLLFLNQCCLSAFVSILVLPHY